MSSFAALRRITKGKAARPFPVRGRGRAVSCREKNPVRKGTRLFFPVVPPNFIARQKRANFDTITGRPSPPTFQRGSSESEFPARCPGGIAALFRPLCWPRVCGHCLHLRLSRVLYRIWPVMASAKARLCQILFTGACPGRRRSRTRRACAAGRTGRAPPRPLRCAPSGAWPRR